MPNSSDIIIKPYPFNKILILLFGLFCLWFAFATDFLPQIAQDQSQSLGLFSIESSLFLLKLLFGGMGVVALLVFLAPYKVKMTPSGIQGPICLAPVPWHEIRRVEYHKIRHTQILVFHMKEGCLARVRICYLFPANQKSFAIVLSQYNADNQQKILDAVKQHCILEKK